MAKSTRFTSKVKTIAHYGIQFGDTLRDVEETYREASHVLFRGRIDAVPDSVWQEVAPIHENFAKYNELAMMALYKGKGKFSKGTESAKNAVLSVLTDHEQNFDYEHIIIWKITGPGNYIERENLKILLRTIGRGHDKIYRSESGKFMSGETFRSWVEEAEENEGTTYRLIGTGKALIEILYGDTLDMSSDEEHDYETLIRPGFKLK